MISSCIQEIFSVNFWYKNDSNPEYTRTTFITDKEACLLHDFAFSKREKEVEITDRTGRSSIYDIVYHIESIHGKSGHSYKKHVFYKRGAI